MDLDRDIPSVYLDEVSLYVVQGDWHGDAKGSVLAGIKLALLHLPVGQRPLYPLLLRRLLARRWAVIEVRVRLVLTKIVLLKMWCNDINKFNVYFILNKQEVNDLKKRSFLKTNKLSFYTKQINKNK